MRKEPKEFLFILLLILVIAVGALWLAFGGRYGQCHKRHPGTCHFDELVKKVERLEQKLK